jgi:hypothetical protein
MNFRNTQGTKALRSDCNQAIWILIVALRSQRPGSQKHELSIYPEPLIFDQNNCTVERANLTDSDGALRIFSSLRDWIGIGFFMNLRHSGGRIRIHVLGTAVSLCFAVFGWGLQYKLSLYDLPGNRSNSVATAKLLSQEERTAAATNSVSTLPIEADTLPPRGCTSGICLSVVLPLLLLISNRAQGIFTICRSWPRRFTESAFFFFRPPPVPFLPK